MKSLKSTIFVFFVALLLAVQAVFLQIVYRAIRQEEANQVEYQLDTARTVFQAQFQSRRESLAAFAETAARDFGLKEVFQADRRSFLVALNNHRQRIGADIALAVTADGKVEAQLLHLHEGGGRVVVGPEQDKAFRYPDWLDLQDDTRLYPLGDAFYQLNLAPLANGSLIVGWIGFGYAIDQALAGYFAELTDLNTDFAVRGDAGWTVFASSRGAAGTGANGALADFILGGGQPEDVIATTFVLGSAGGREIATVMSGDRTDLVAEIRNRWQDLGLLGALTLLLSLAGAFIIATRISRPVQLLAEQAKRIGGGDYDLSFDVKAGGELGVLAEEFRLMQQALQGRERLISHHAYHDDLTGLPNRNRLIQVLEEWTAKPSLRFGLSKFSIRRINHINSSLGHAIGDEVIKTVAARFAGIAAPDALFHLGGSEFVALNPLAAGEQPEMRMFLLMKLMEPKFRYQGISLYLELQAGIALFPDHDASPSGLLRKASTAMQQAKKNAQPFQVYHPDMSSETEGYLLLINDLKTAIDQEQLVLHYQPKLDLATGRVHAVEALVRWQHPERGMIPPDRFISVAEQTGLIHSLTRWVLGEAARQHEVWRGEGLALAIAVNVSAQNLKDPGFYDMVMTCLAASGVGRQAISLEMTESAVMDDLDKAVALLSRFEAERIEMAIDDYGTGYSALAQLKQLPVSELKIDRSFIIKLLEDKDNPIIVRSTIELAHNMGLRVVAEGVEDASSLAWLREHGCDLVQGYHVCRPKPAEELALWLRGLDPVTPGGEGRTSLPL